jgi:hypothetical protein
VDSNSATSQAVEYRQVFLDWASSPMLENHNKKPPHPESYARAAAAKAQRVYDELSDLLSAGWSLDGPFDAAVSYEFIYKNRGWEANVRKQVLGAHVKLRRVR